MKQKHIEILALFSELYKVFPRLEDDQAEVYANALEPYSLDAVRRGIKHAIAEWRSTKFPPVGLLVEGSKGALGAYPAARSKRYPWDEQEFRARRLVSDFMKGYGLSPDATKAKAEGWERDLLRYVREVATIQAKLIVGLHNIGMDPVVFRIGEEIDLDLFDRRKAATSSIHVHLPKEAIRFWQAEAARPKPVITERRTYASLPASEDGWFEKRTAEIVAARAEQLSPEAKAAAQVGSQLSNQPPQPTETP